MANVRNQLTGTTAGNSQGWLANLLAEERELNTHMLWQLASWGAMAVGALVAAFYAAHIPDGASRGPASSVDLFQQTQLVQQLTKEDRAETRRLSLAIDTLNGDRDRLYARVTTLEQGLDSVTGSIARQAPAGSLVVSSAAQIVNQPQSVIAPLPFAPQSPASVSAAPSPVETTSAAGSTEQKSTVASAPASKEPEVSEPMASPDGPLSSDQATSTRVEPRSIPPVVALDADKMSGQSSVVSSLSVPPETNAMADANATETAVQRTEFGVDLGAANSIDGLARALAGCQQDQSGTDVAAPSDYGHQRAANGTGSTIAAGCRSAERCRFRCQDLRRARGEWPRVRNGDFRWPALGVKGNARGVERSASRAEASRAEAAATRRILTTSTGYCPGASVGFFVRISRQS